MKTFFLALGLLALPLAGPSGLLIQPAFAAATVTELGDLSVLRAIVADTLDIATKGDLAGAAKRIADFETAWDANTSKLRALSTDRWGNIDAASDAALAALRANPPVADTVGKALSELIAALDDPSQPVGGTTDQSATKPAGVVATTDANGHPIPCEEMLKDLRTALSAATPTDADKATLDDLQNKGIERCNADDDKRADDFFAQGLTLLGK